VTATARVKHQFNLQKCQQALSLTAPRIVAVHYLCKKGSFRTKRSPCPSYITDVKRRAHKRQCNSQAIHSHTRYSPGKFRHPPAVDPLTQRPSCSEMTHCELASSFSRASGPKLQISSLVKQRQKSENDILHKRTGSADFQPETAV